MHVYPVSLLFFLKLNINNAIDLRQHMSMCHISCTWHKSVRRETDPQNLPMGQNSQEVQGRVKKGVDSKLVSRGEDKRVE